MLAPGVSGFWMSRYLFAYGTLQPGLTPQEIAPVVAKLRPLGEGFLFGTLYDLGKYPGAVLDPASPRRVYGTVFSLPRDLNIWPQLDAYEGFDANHPQESQFVRSKARVTLVETGQALFCWVYAWNAVTDGAHILESGRFILPGSNHATVPRP
jgi:gamma-glutamylcyclotransferase (GGCT)/AIG2-like uncharacterized protein YtfP